MVWEHSYLLAIATFVGATLTIGVFAVFQLDRRTARPKRASVTSPRSRERSK